MTKVNIEDAKNYKKCVKKSYEVSACIPAQGTLIINKLEQAALYKKLGNKSYFTAEQVAKNNLMNKYANEIRSGAMYLADGKTVCLCGTVGEMWLTKLETVVNTYTLSEGNPVTPDVLLRGWRKLKTKTTFGGATNFACFVPVSQKGQIKTSSKVLSYNDPLTKHGKGDFIVCTALPNGKPNLADKRVVNGEVFATTYNNTGFADCLGKVNAVNSVNFNTLPDLCTKAVEDDKYTLNIKTFEKKANLVIDMLAKEFNLKFSNAEINEFPDYYLYHSSENEIHWKNAYVARNMFYATDSNAVKVKGQDGKFYDKVYIELVVPMNKKHGCFHVNMRVLKENYSFNAFEKDYCFDIDMPSNSCKQEDGFYSNANFSFSTMNCEQMVNAILQHKNEFSFMYNIATKSAFSIVRPTENTKRVLKAFFDGVCSETEKNDLTSVCKQIKKYSEVTVFGTERKASCDELLKKYNLHAELCFKSLNLLLSAGLKDIGVILTEEEMHKICLELCSSSRVEMDLFIGATKTGKTSFPYDSFIALPVVAIEYSKDGKNFVVLSYRTSAFTSSMMVIPSDHEVQSLINDMVISIKELNPYFLKKANAYFDRIEEISDAFFSDIHTYFDENDYVILQKNRLKNQIMINGDNDDKVAIRYHAYLDEGKLFIQVQGKSNGVTLNQTFKTPLPEDLSTINYWPIFEIICKKFSLNPYRRIERVIELLKKDFPDIHRDTRDTRESCDLLKWNFKIHESEHVIRVHISGQHVVWDIDECKYTNMLNINENINSVVAQLRQAIKQIV